MDRGKLTDLIAVVVIAVVGLFTAYITFGVLQSQAEAKLQGYSVGGAIAGALVTMSVLASVYGQFRKSSVETDELRSRNEELQQKLIRGAPRPPGFDTQVDERQRIVLAIPRTWEPRGGLVFDFETDPSELSAEDLVPARFSLGYTMVTDVTASPDVFYEDYRASVNGVVYVESHTSEFLYLGGDGGGGVKCLKIIAHEYASARKHSDPLTGRVTFSWENISKQDFEARMARQQPSDVEAVVPERHPKGVRVSDQQVSPSENEPSVGGEVKDGSGGDAPMKESDLTHSSGASGETQVREVAVLLSRMRVICYHPGLQRVYQFDFVDDAKDFPASSILFNQLLNSVRFLT